MAADGHLGYYMRHDISPVHYRMETLRTHFERRDSLYRSLGLPPAVFRNARVLEVAPGSGQNSLYIAACQPSGLDLVEPNPAAVRDIEANYADFQIPHTVPQLHAERLESFSSPALFDIVICENWLGSLPSDLNLLTRLSMLVAPGGVLVFTIVPLSGFFPNVMRKLLALRLTDRSAAFDEQTKSLVDAFAPHLATIANMTRSHVDWVHDCMMNPHYLNVALPLDTAMEAVGDMEILGTFPRFTPDWRWFKGLTGENRRFNEVVLNAYRENVHNFVDYRTVYSPLPIRYGECLDDQFTSLHKLALEWQSSWENDCPRQVAQASEMIGNLLGSISGNLENVDDGLSEAVRELETLWEQSELSLDAVRNVKFFGGLFGRETVYVSFTRPGVL